MELKENKTLYYVFFTSDSELIFLTIPLVLEAKKQKIS